MNPEDVALPPHRSVSIVVGDCVARLAKQADESSSAESTDSVSRPVQSSLSAKYRKLMRWYPKEWRLGDEDAMLGILLDVADHAGRTTPTRMDGARIMAAGLSQRFGLIPRGHRIRLLPLSLGAALSVFYAAFIIWAPATRYVGSIGPFSNPSIVTCGLLVMALFSALFLRGKAASFLALAAAGVEIAVGVLSTAFEWQGPGWSAVILFTGLAVLSGSYLRERFSLVAGALVVVAGASGAVVASWLFAASGQFTVVSAVGSALTILMFLAAVAVAAVKVRRRSS